VYTLGAAPAPVIAPRAITVTPTPVQPPVSIRVLSNPLMNQAFQKLQAAAAAKAAAVKTGIAPVFRTAIANQAVQKMITGSQAMSPATPTVPSVIERTGLNPPAIATPTINPDSPFSLVPTGGGGGGGAAVTTPDVQQASIFPGDTTDAMAQVDQAQAAGDLSAQEVASIKSDLATKAPAVPTSWIPVVLLIGLVAVSVAASRRTGGRIGRRGWGD